MYAIRSYYEFFTDSWDNLYSAEMKTGKIFILFSLLAIMIAILGLIGLMTRNNFV